MRGSKKEQVAQDGTFIGVTIDLPTTDDGSPVKAVGGAGYTLYRLLFQDCRMTSGPQGGPVYDFGTMIDTLTILGGQVQRGTGNNSRDYLFREIDEPSDQEYKIIICHVQGSSTEIDCPID